MNQSTALPIYQKAETRIKALVLLAFIHAWPEIVLRSKITAVILAVEAKIGLTAYNKGLRNFAIKMMREQYRKPLYQFKDQFPDKKPIDFKYLKNEAKGGTYYDYPKELKKRITQLTNEVTTASEDGKKPISLWAKAEIDTRQEHNQKMIDDLIEKGEVLCYISSHPNCSKRCAPWQGKLVHLTKRASNPPKWTSVPTSSLIVDKIDGRNVYSLTNIREMEDKYGYHNSVFGFNCRHYLIPYEGQNPPTHYTKDEMKDERKIEQRIREMERAIRKEKQRLTLMEKGGVDYKRQKRKVEYMVETYRAFCKKWGFPSYDYRIV